MPRITQERRDAKRANIVAAARRCFSRDGFHQTSMPDIAREAGVSAGASYRYFAGKEDIILEIAGEAFGVMFAPLERVVSEERSISVAELVAASVGPVSGDVTHDAAGQSIPVDELLRCAVQIWGELLRNDQMRQRAAAGFDRVRAGMADALRRGQEAGTVSADLDPDRGTRVVMALLHGFILQRTTFGLDDTAGFTHDARTLLSDAGILVTAKPTIQ
jgi:AcrR family transcriptional regulator